SPHLSGHPLRLRARSLRAWHRWRRGPRCRSRQWQAPWSFRRLDVLEPDAAAVLEQSLDPQLRARDQRLGRAQVLDALLEQLHRILELDVLAVQLRRDTLEPVDPRTERHLRSVLLVRTHDSSASVPSTRPCTVPSTTRSRNDSPSTKSPT